jgi:ferredoxin
VAHKNDIELEGACEGSLACSTCHIIMEDRDVFDRLPEPDDDENDMLDLAFGKGGTPRLHWSEWTVLVCPTVRLSTQSR